MLMALRLAAHRGVVGDPNPNHRRRASARPVSVLVCALLVSVLAGGVGAQSTRSALEITAEFADAGAIIPGNDVVVDGV
ncbi:MAG: hypothetical protein ACRDZ7_18140 [Acidimicrobiia bacterium]